MSVFGDGLGCASELAFLFSFAVDITMVPCGLKIQRGTRHTHNILGFGRVGFLLAVSSCYVRVLWQWPKYKCSGFTSATTQPQDLLWLGHAVGMTVAILAVRGNGWPKSAASVGNS